MKVSFLPLFFLSASWVSAFNIVVEFPDESSFFQGNATARATIRKAAKDISDAITSHLDPVSASYPRTISAQHGNDYFQTTGWHIQYANPNNGGGWTSFNGSLAEDEVRFFVGMTDFSGLQRATSFSQNVSYSGSGYWPATNANNLQIAMNKVQATAESHFKRGGTVLQLHTESHYGKTFQTNVGTLVGSLSFDNDLDGDGLDSMEDLASFWHLDANTNVAAGKLDLYTIALHEMLHSVGISNASHNWTTQHNGTTWLGENAIAVNGGSGENILNSDGQHVSGSILSKSIVTGNDQRSVMYARIANGERRTLTELDLALLRDIGYTTVPEPSSLILLTLSSVGLLWHRNKK